MKKHKNLLFFIALMLFMQTIGPLILLALKPIQFVNDNMYLFWYLSVPIIGFLSIFISIKWFKLKLDLKLLSISNSVFFYGILLIIAFNIFQIALDSTFLEDLFDNKLRFLKTNLFFENNLMFYLNFIIPVLLAPIYEEIFYRQIMLIKLLDVYKPIISILITSIVFALMHTDLNGMIAYFFIGLFYTYIYYVTRNIWFNIFLHSVFNLIAFFTKITVHEYGGNFFFMGIFIYLVLLILIVFSVKRITILTREKD